MNNMPGYSVTIICLPWPGDEGWRLSLWQSTPTQALADYEGWYMETPYRPLQSVLAALPAMHGVPLGPLLQHPRVLQLMAAHRIPNFEDQQAVVRALAPTYQMAFCLSNFQGGLDLYISPFQGAADYLKYVTGSSGDPNHWHRVVDWSMLGLFPLPDWDPLTARPLL